MFAWVGYDQSGVRYSREARYAGKTKFPLRKMLSFAADGIVSFSAAPLRLALALGFVVSALSILGAPAGGESPATGTEVPGWASIIVSMAFLGGVQLMVLGVMGAYIARIYEEVKRPLYLVRDRSATGRERTTVFDEHAVSYGSESSARLRSRDQTSSSTALKAERLLELCGRHLGGPADQRCSTSAAGSASRTHSSSTESALSSVSIRSASILERAAARNPGATSFSTVRHRSSACPSSADLAFAICVLHHVRPPVPERRSR